MDSHNKIPRKINARESVSAHPKSMPGTIGLSLTIYSAIIVFGSLFIFVFAGDPLLPLGAFLAVTYGGLLLGIMGGVLSSVSLSRGEDIITSGIAFRVANLMGNTTTC
jgi:hypothetical protein